VKKVVCGILMSYPRVFADFHNADAEGRLRLNCIGTIEDLARHHIELRDGQLLTLYSEDLEVDGTVQYSEIEKLWVATISWEQVRQVEDIDLESHGIDREQAKALRASLASFSDDWDSPEMSIYDNYDAAKANR
jgi:hypothetical protein